MGAFQKLFGSMPPLQVPLEAPTAVDFPKQREDDDEQYRVPTKLTDFPWPRSIPMEQVTPLWGPEDCRNLKPIVHGGESQALQQLQKSLKDPSWVASFEKPKTSCTATQSPSTTGLSPYLSWGCLSPRQVWFAINETLAKTKTKPTQPPVSLHGQLLWRDFNHLMAHDANRHVPGSWGQMEGNKHCRNIPWDDNPDLLQAWQKGETGYPWIDACMKQLAQEGWIHHLGRHAVACFLTRGDLWQSWVKGAEHFESHLLDADYALNGFNWMWLSCSGFFYQYFRCYSPVSFQQKNDPSGTYIRKWLPVLAKLPNKYIYEPWKAPIAVQKMAGIRIGIDYPKPLVNHSVVSKENMSKMAYAYELHKEREAESKRKSTSSPKKPAAKRQKQTKLK
jgi:cryptochrome